MLQKFQGDSTKLQVNGVRY